MGLFLLAVPASPQEPREGPPPASAEARPGRFRIGPFYLNPSFRIGNVGMDTNVFFSSVDRKRDLTFSAGPGLELVLPVKRSVRFSTSGSADYLYFAQSASQRRLTGGGGARFQWKAPRMFLGIERAYSRSFQRPEFEVDSRVSQGQWQTRVNLQIGGAEGRVGVTTGLVAKRVDVDAGQTFLGADLRKNLARDEYRALVGLQYRLTIKTGVVLEGDYQQDRFQADPTRDADSNRVAGGLQVTSSTLLSGRALVGIRSFRPRHPSGADETLVTYAQVEAIYVASPRTRLDGRYTRDLTYSAFTPSGDTPTIRTEIYGLKIDKALVGRFDLRISGGLRRLLTDGAVTVEVPGEGRRVAVRDDTVKDGSVDLGYEFRSRLRIGIALLYADRRSTISYFGTRGLVVGATVTYSGTPSVTYRP